MDYIFFPHRNADAIVTYDAFLSERYQEFMSVLDDITEAELIADFQRQKAAHPSYKSLAPSINSIIRRKMSRYPNWKSEVDIFNDTEGLIRNTEWRLDFACENGIAVEVAFNHGEAVAWNLIKPVLSSELNHVNKALQTRMGIYVCATDEMKVAGNFDKSSGSYEKVLRYLKPMMNQLTIPMMIIGLKAPSSFRIDAVTRDVVFEHFD